ncbi:MAG: hypothetical protein IVW57_03380 [Ktedonobacterales bacterium]|nr:hypothetical protein [Ktedonobacterales bacterium]
MTPPVSTTCAQGIGAKTLSAWRDDLLPIAEAQRLGAHTSTCAACRTTLATFETVAQSLRSQRELEPSDRVWRGVRARIARVPRRHAHASIWRGLGAVASIAAVVALFIYILSSGPGRRGPVGGTATMTPQPTTSSSPTSTPSSIPLSVAQAWGTQAATGTLSTQLDATHTFQATSITPDGRTLLGIEYIPSGTAGRMGSASAGALDIATKRFTAFGVSQVANYAPRCCATDGRYAIVADSTAPGATCGVCHDRYWSYDLLTRQLRQVAGGDAYQGILGSALDHGLLFLSTGMGIQVADLQANTIVPFAGTATARVLAYTWPYVVYTPASASNSSMTIRVRDLTTNAESTLPRLSALYASAADGSVGLTITGDTLFALVTRGTGQGGSDLLELDHLTAPDAQPYLLVHAPTDLGILASANARLVILNGGLALAWDRVERAFVQVSGVTNTGGSGDGARAALVGNQLAVIEPAPPPNAAFAPQQVTLYNTAQLPTHG